MGKITKSPEQLYEDLKKVAAKLYRVLPGDEEQKEKTLNENFSQIAKEVKAEIKAKNEKTKSKSSERKEPEYLANLLEMAREGKLQKDIASKVEKSIYTVAKYMEKHGIMAVRKIKSMLKKYYANPEAEEKLNEEWAKETGVYPETIARFKDEIKEKRKEPEYSADLLEMAREGKLQKEIASKLGKSIYTVSRYMEKHGIMAARKIKSMLKKYYANPEVEEKTDEEWAKETGVYPETIARFKDEIKEKRKEPEYLADLLEMAREGKLQKEIASKVGKTIRTVSIYIKKQGIMAAGKIKSMLKEYYANPEAKEKTNEEWARETGVYPETIARFKDEIKEKRKEPEYLADLLEMAREGKIQKEIASELEKSIMTVSKYMEKHGIMSTRKIKFMLREYYANPEAEEKIDEEWAKETGVYPETIARFKAEIQTNIKSKKKIDDKSNVTKPQNREIRDVELSSFSKGALRRQNYQKPTIPKANSIQRNEEKDSIIEKVKPMPTPAISVQQLSEQLGINLETVQEIISDLNTYPAVNYIAKKYRNVSDEEVERINKEVEKAKYLREHSEIKYKLRFIETKGAIQGVKACTSEEFDPRAAETLKYKIDVLVTEFSQYLKPEDYALLCYGYDKIGFYKRAMEVGKHYLQVEEDSVVALEKKIREILDEKLQSNKKKKEEASR